ncbi:glycosyltransferase family 29 protein [Bradyrhizobium yuanmingense]|uniref:glycosyltransferase family 29 protein n=1 Tax=Bradyrhizobium yuanmingense TaxID=108015 RepID=UPI003D2F0592
MRIAIVGNGGGPLKMKLGPLIDRCDRVVRINEFRTNGYEESVGHAYAREVDYFSQLVQRGAITRLDVRAP